METRNSLREKQIIKAKKAMAALSNAILDEIASYCAACKEVAEEVWLTDNRRETGRDYGKGEISAYDDVLKKLEEMRQELAAYVPDAAVDERP